VLRQPRVTSALIGASSVAQLDNNLDALTGSPLSAEEIAAIEPFAVHGTGSH
jgi:L-glyceraldehyde 3-phosphate reductase